MASLDLMGTSCTGICQEHQLSIFRLTRRGVCGCYVLRELIYEQIGYYQLLVHIIPISIRHSDHQMGLLAK